MWTKCNGSLTKYKQGKQSVMGVQQSMNKVSWFVNKIWISTKHEQYINKMQTEFKQSMKLSLHFVGTYTLEEHRRMSGWESKGTEGRPTT